jgi:hypothetical protein
MKLFDRKERSDIRPASGNENTFHYFNDTARPEVIPLREVMEIWFKDYPDSEKVEMKERLISDFYPAFYELAMYQYFKNMGYDVTIHPAVPETKKRPDFLVKNEADEFYVEIKEMQMVTYAEELERRKLNTLYDSMNSIDNTNFMICIDKIKFKSSRQPSGKKVIKHFDAIMHSLYPDVILQNEVGHRRPRYAYEDEDVSIIVGLLPKSADHRGRKGRAIGSYGSYTKLGGDEEKIKKALNKKTTRYGNLDKPFIICLNYPSSFLHQEDIAAALYGQDNIFGTPDKPNNTRVSGILITGFTVSGLTNAKFYYNRHPNAKKVAKFSPSDDLIKCLGLTDAYVVQFGTE